MTTTKFSGKEFKLTSKMYCRYQSTISTNKTTMDGDLRSWAICLMLLWIHWKLTCLICTNWDTNHGVPRVNMLGKWSLQGSWTSIKVSLQTLFSIIVINSKFYVLSCSWLFSWRRSLFTLARRNGYLQEEWIK